jgi:SDR family mycofactocin-dependent oxidoreductase
MGRLDGRVALVTGAARGQGRVHAQKLAAEGADIVALDICGELDGIELAYRLATPEDLELTAASVRATGRRIETAVCDVRDLAAVTRAVEGAVARLGRLDIVVANAGVFAFGDRVEELAESTWDVVMDVNAKGVWNTCRAAIPHIVAGGAGGSIVVISSTAGIKGAAHVGAYAASKHAVVGLMKTMASELGRHGIRVNSVHPCSVDTDMVLNDALFRLFRPDLEAPTQADAAESMTAGHLLPVPWVEAEDVSEAVLFLSSDSARYITGTELVVDAGYLLR